MHSTKSRRIDAGCTASDLVADDELVFVTGDSDLGEAAQSIGLHVARTTS